LGNLTNFSLFTLILLIDHQNNWQNILNTLKRTMKATKNSWNGKKNLQVKISLSFKIRLQKLVLADFAWKLQGDNLYYNIINYIPNATCFVTCDVMCLILFEFVRLANRINYYLKFFLQGANWSNPKS
jgi:hypothetical protein